MLEYCRILANRGSATMEINIDRRRWEIVKMYSLDLGYWELCFWQNHKCQINNLREADVCIKNLDEKE